jgi:hypothetical protein
MFERTHDHETARDELEVRTGTVQLYLANPRRATPSALVKFPHR